jgi:phosphatidylserine/phosphatidylglycerophosphate/cardiolipin synthase-like enzyme
MLTQEGIAPLLDAAHAIAHNKVMIIDNAAVITGSFNFSKAAEERNAENLLVVHSRELAAKYFKNWKDHQTHSVILSR